VVGTVVTSTVDDGVSRPKYLLVEPADHTGSGGGSQIIALDVVGAGPGELVVLAQGSSARQTPQTDKTAIDAVIAGIVDAVNLGGETTYRK
jgi:microcompartment protein CcmK/EutM